MKLMSGWSMMKVFAVVCRHHLQKPKTVSRAPEMMVGAIWCTGEGINVLVVWDGVGILFFIMFNTSNSHHSRYEVDMVNSQHSRIGPRI